MARMKTYVCPTFPKLQFGDKIKFSHGFFKTDSLQLQNQLERSSSFGWRIMLLDEDVPEDVIDGIEAEIVVANEVGVPVDPLDLVADALPGDGESCPAAKADEPDLSWVTKTWLNSARRADLVALAEDVGVDDIASKNKVVLVRAIEQAMSLKRSNASNK